MVRKLYTLLIVSFFAVMMVLLWRDHIIPSLTRDEGVDIDRRVLTDSWIDTNDYFLVYLDQVPLGAIHNATNAEPAAEGEEFYSSTAHIEINAFLFRGRIMMAARLNRRLELESGSVRAHLPPPGQPVYTPEELWEGELPPGAYEAALLARGQDINLRLRRDDAVQFRQLPLTRPVTMSDSLAPVLRGQMMSEDTIYSLDVYEPLWGGNAGQVQVQWVDTQEVIDENGTQQAMRIIEVRYDQVKTTLTVDPAGNVVRREIPLFAGGGKEASGEAFAGSKIIMVRQEANPALRQFPSLVYEPKPRSFTAADFEGQDTGQVINMSAFSMLTGGLKGMRQ